MPALRAQFLALVLTRLVIRQQTISIPTQDGGRICVDLYSKGDRAVVLAHGGRFNEESSSGPGQADFDHAPFEKDVLAAVRYLKTHGVKTVSVVWG
jgi:hypothetical protein